MKIHTVVPGDIILYKGANALHRFEALVLDNVLVKNFRLSRIKRLLESQYHNRSWAASFEFTPHDTAAIQSISSNHPIAYALATPAVIASDVGVKTSHFISLKDPCLYVRVTGANAREVYQYRQEIYRRTEWSSSQNLAMLDYRLRAYGAYLHNRGDMEKAKTMSGGELKNHIFLDFIEMGLGFMK